MKRSKVWMLASILALGGMSVSTIGTPLLTVQAAEEATVAAKEYHTQGGIANMGSGTANITIKGKEIPCVQAVPGAECTGHGIHQLYLQSNL